MNATFDTFRYKTPLDAFQAGDYLQALAGFTEYRNKRNSNAWDAEIAIARKRLYAQWPPVFCILDEMSLASWGDVMCLECLTAENWQAKLQEGPWPLFIESAWRGVDDSWRRAMVLKCRDTPIAKMLGDLLASAREQGKKIIFWNKEDPLHFDNFFHIAKQADVVLTTDSNSIARYRSLIPGATVDCLPFAANAKLCNPAGRAYDDAGTVCFAGSNYIRQHNDRLIQLKMLLPVIESYSGVIYDRNFASDDYSRSFPLRYKPYLHEPLPFVDMVGQYKRFKFFLNVNTITDSPTMMARRVYELLACGTPVISWPGKAIEVQFDGIVQIVTSARQAARIMDDYLNDTEKWKRLSHLGYREVMRKHTYRHRARILSKYALMQWQERPVRTSVLALASSPAHMERLLNSICRQTQDNLEFIIGARGLSATARENLAVQIRNRCRDAPLAMLEIPTDVEDGTALARLAAQATGAYCAVFDETCFYFPEYLADMLLPFTYTDAGIVGKAEVWYWLEGINETHQLNPGCCHRFGGGIVASTLICKRELLSGKSGLLQESADLAAFVRAAKAGGTRIYVADPYNFVGICNGDGLFERERKSRLSRFAANGFARRMIAI